MLLFLLDFQAVMTGKLDLATSNGAASDRAIPDRPDSDLAFSCWSASNLEYFRKKPELRNSPEREKDRGQGKRNERFFEQYD